MTRVDDRLGEALAEAGLAALDGAEGEVVVRSRRGGLTRFANSQVHQSVAVEDLHVAVRAVLPDGRSGVAGARADTPDAAAEAGRRALAAAAAGPADPDFPGVAGPAPVPELPLDAAALAAGPEERAALVRELLAEVPPELEAAGALATGGEELLVLTSAGQHARSLASHAALSMVAEGASSSGWAEEGGRALADVDAGGAARRAVGKALAGADPRPVEPGDWPVVLEPSAVGTLAQFLAWLGFGAKDVHEERSFVAGRLGERLFDPSLTLLDDPFAPGAVGLALDPEGTPKQRVTLVEQGVLRGVVHDRRTAAAAGVDSSGHALDPPNPYGPVALHPVLLPGEGGSVDDLIARTERGLLVTRFHYTNVVHPLRTLLTGMTRDGTFLIEDGQVRHGVRNLRFTEALTRALAEVDAVGSQTGFAADDGWSGARYPALALPRFAFTSATTF